MNAYGTDPRSIALIMMARGSYDSARLRAQLLHEDHFPTWESMSHAMRWSWCYQWIRCQPGTIDPLIRKLIAQVIACKHKPSNDVMLVCYCCDEPAMAKLDLTLITEHGRTPVGRRNLGPLSQHEDSNGRKEWFHSSCFDAMIQIEDDEDLLL